MPNVTNWIKKTIDNLIDPDKEERVEDLVRVLQDGLRKQQKSFSLAKILQGIDFTEKDLAIAQAKVYRTILDRGWKDGKLTAEEQQVARWAAIALGISASDADRINQEYARSRFAVALAQSMEDGILDTHEEIRLQQIAASVGTTMPQFTRSFFRTEGERFLRGIFIACVADGSISAGEWNCLIATTGKLGLTRQELLQAVAPQAQQFVEHVLADAKADGRLSQAEEDTLRWLLDNLCVSAGFREYVLSEMSTLEALTRIEDGKIPVVNATKGIETRAGELVYFQGGAVWREVRMLKSGPTSSDHHGMLTITDSRLVFTSSTKSVTSNLRKVVSHRGAANWIEVTLDGKAASTYFLQEHSPLPYAIFRAAVAMANQTLTAKVEGTPSRHIPRDVRQRAWQRYGGRCAECGAGDYLEFDHIIPVAKGGSNSDTNVQLLCRRCNLKKSDRI